MDSKTDRYIYAGCDGVEQALPHCKPDTERVEADRSFSTFRQIQHELFSLYREKDIRYKSSFHKTFKKYGLVASAIRLSDKVERFETLVATPYMETDDERLEDTLRDLANYAVMTLVELRLNKEMR